MATPELRSVLSVLAAELQDLAQGIDAVQSVPLLPSDAEQRLSGEDLLRAIVALQDLDRLAQTANALSIFTQALAISREDDCEPEVFTAALLAVPLDSVAGRLAQRLS